MPRADYRFIEKDPIIDLIRTAYLASNMMAHEIAVDARISPQTMDNWLYGVTKRPQNRTCTAVLDVLGVDIHYTYRATGQAIVARPGVARKFMRKPKRRTLKTEQAFKLRAVS